MVLFGVSKDPIDLNGGIVFDLKALSAVITYFIGIEVADLTFHAVVAVFRFV